MALLRENELNRGKGLGYLSGSVTLYIKNFADRIAVYFWMLEPHEAQSQRLFGKER
jgi:hypothetical protein